jgi:hypothetical protein
VTDVSQTFENNGRQVQEPLIDPGPMPGVTPLRPQQRELRQALATKTTPMRKDVDR